MAEEINKNIFDEVEGKEEKTASVTATVNVEPQVKVPSIETQKIAVETVSKEIVAKENSIAELKERREEILNNGTLAELNAVDEELQEKEHALKAPSLDDLDDVPDSDKYKMITIDTVVPEEGLIFTIEDVYLQAPALTDYETGAPIEPTTSDGGSYYKAKIGVKFKEEFNGSKVKQTIPSIYYSVDENGQIAKVPGIPKACDEAGLKNNMVPSTAKLRHRYCKFLGVEPNTVSNKDFVKGLVGKKVRVVKESGEHKKRKWAKLQIVEFVN